MRAEPISELGWTRDPNVREGIRPVLADRGYTAQFLGSRRITLTNQARTLFLDCVLDNYIAIAAVSLLERRADGDYAADELPAQFRKFSPRACDAKAHSPWALFEGWVKSRQPAQSTVNRWRVVFENYTPDTTPQAFPSSGRHNYPKIAVLREQLERILASPCH